MPKSTTNGAITQLTASGNSSEVDIAQTVVGASFSIRHTNGTGTITAGATVRAQISHDGTNWDDDVTFSFLTSASATETRTYVPPTEGVASGQKVRFVYTAPTGSTGHTLNARYTIASQS